MTDTKQDVRQQFEAEMRKEGYLLTRDGDYYIEQSMSFAYIGYRMALQSLAVRELVEAMIAAMIHADRVRDEMHNGDRTPNAQAHYDRLIGALAPFAALRTLGAGHVE